MHLTLNIDPWPSTEPLPPLYRIRRRFAHGAIADVVSATIAQLEQLGLREQIRPGMRIAVTAGSRGIRDVLPITRTAVAWLRNCGAEPFVVPAMGSHGGATAEGQLAMLASLGLNEASLGCPLLATMEVVELGTLADGTAVYLDRYAAEADGILLINRVKAHTSFSGPIESGLAKMLAVGLGKREGAALVHGEGSRSLREKIVPMARLAIAKSRVLGGLAIVENAREETALLVGLPPAEIGAAGEAALLEQSKAMLARLPFEQLDVLVVEEIGKTISGTGMDTNVIGRRGIRAEAPPPTPQIGVIVALDLAEASHGNAAGVGLADIITAQLAGKIDFRATYINMLTAGIVGLTKAALPITLPDEQSAIATAIKVCGRVDPAAVRLCRIRNTLLLDELQISAALLPEAEAHGELERV
jgi:hypothetical protein